MASNEKKEQNACPRSIQYTEAAARYWSPNYIQHSAHIRVAKVSSTSSRPVPRPSNKSRE
jgi:hypothetical protein